MAAAISVKTTASSLPYYSHSHNAEYRILHLLNPPSLPPFCFNSLIIPSSLSLHLEPICNSNCFPSSSSSSSPSCACPLYPMISFVILRLQDVDDGEACNLCQAFCENKSVRTLGLASNKIGNNEMLNSVQPDFKTGGEAVAEMLLINSTLTELDLSWNSIRLESAIALGTSCRDILQ